MIKGLKTRTKLFYNHFNRNKAIIKPWQLQKMSGKNSMQSVFVQFLEASIQIFHNTEILSINFLKKPFTTKAFTALAQLMKRYQQP